MKKINLQILIHVVFRSSVLPTEKERDDFKSSESSTDPTTNDFAMFTTAKVILTEDNESKILNVEYTLLLLAQWQLHIRHPLSEFLVCDFVIPEPPVLRMLGFCLKWT